MPRKAVACGPTRETSWLLSRGCVHLQNNLRTGTGGSCGFGPTGITGYPDGAIASVNGSIAIIGTEAEKGCGACIQFTCIDAVRPFLA